MSGDADEAASKSVASGEWTPEMREFLDKYGGIRKLTDDEVALIRVAASIDMAVHPLPDGDRCSVECRRCAAVATLPDWSVWSVWQAALRHMAECPTPHEEPPPPWRDVVKRGDSDA